MTQAQIIFQPSGMRGCVETGLTVLEAARTLGADVLSICGGAKNCGKCKIRPEYGTFERYGITSTPDHLSVMQAEESAFLTAAEIAKGYRLACHTVVLGDLLIEIPEESRAHPLLIRKAIREKTLEIRPAVRLYTVTLSPPSFRDPLGDGERLLRGLREQQAPGALRFDQRVLQQLSATLRRGNWTVTAGVWMDEEILAIWPGRVADAYGLAVDVGTTTVAGYLCSLQTGRIAATASRMNPQVTFGEDVMSRITYGMNHPGEGLERLHRAIIDGLNALCADVCAAAGIAREEILETVIVGNTTMHHLLLKLDPTSLGVSPFPPAVHASQDVKARDLGLGIHPAGNVHLLPNESGFVGADNVGVLLALAPHEQDEQWLILDVGTNGEMVLGNRRRLLSASCATGPALEGAHIRFGMRAAPGAVERIRVHQETFTVEVKVVGEAAWHGAEDAPSLRGICGSGIIDGVAELYRAGIIESSGRFRRDGTIPGVRQDEKGRWEFVIAPRGQTAIGADLTITQQDVRNVQLAKGALLAGARILLRRLGLALPDRILLAGAFGSYIDPEQARRIGMIPACPLDRIETAGNAAGEGARLALLNRDKRREADRLAGQVESVELTLEKDFQEIFVESLSFPVTT